MKFSFQGQDLTLSSDASLEMFPLISHTQAKRALKNNTKAFLIYVTEVENITHSSPSAHKEFLASYDDCFADDYPEHLPPSRGDLDHSIEIFPGIPPPHKAPYRHSPLHQTEIQKQVTELLEKGLIKTSSSPYGAPVLLVQKKKQIIPHVH